MTAPGGGPPFLQPTVASYPGARYFPDINEVAVPFVTPSGGTFLFSKSGALYVRDAAGEFQLLTSATPVVPIVPVKAITHADSPYQVVPTDGVILVDTSGGAVTVMLEAAPAQGHEVVVKRTTTDANAVTVAHNGNNIEGTASDLVLAGGALTSTSLVVFTASGWWIV